MTSKYDERFKHGHKMCQTNRRLTDHPTKKREDIGGTICAIDAILPNNVTEQVGSRLDG